MGVDASFLTNRPHESCATRSHNRDTEYGEAEDSWHVHDYLAPAAYARPVALAFCPTIPSSVFNVCASSGERIALLERVLYRSSTDLTVAPLVVAPSVIPAACFASARND